MEAETGLIVPHTKKYLGLLEVKELRKDSLLEASEGAWPCQHLNVRFLACGTVKEYISIVLSHPVCGTGYASPRKEYTWLINTIRKCLSHSYLLYSASVLWQTARPTIKGIFMLEFINHTLKDSDLALKSWFMFYVRLFNPSFPSLFTLIYKWHPNLENINFIERLECQISKRLSRK